MVLLDIRNLRIDIKTPNGLIRIVDNVSFTLNEGEICGLVGESGSGKSLIAKVICNAFKDSWIVTADRFRFNDVELLKLTPTQRRQIVGKEISMVFQDPLTCLDPSQKIGKQLIHSGMDVQRALVATFIRLAKTPRYRIIAPCRH